MKIKYILLQKVEDEQKNQLIIKADQPTQTMLKVSIRLANEDKQRRVAEVDLKEKKMYMQRDHTKHYHRVSGSYGFNWTVINQSSGWDTLVLSIRGEDGDMDMYAIPRKVIIDNGKVLNFKQQGFELQKFVPLAIIQQYKMKDKFILNYVVK